MASRLIKKYPNRRLYDTRTSTYITLADVKQLVLDQEEFQVVDAKTTEDLTRSILLQIILEEEAGGAPMFTSDMLSQMIRFYGNAMQSVMGQYLETNLQAFVDMQDKMRDQAKTMFGQSKLNPQDMWSKLASLQPPAMQNIMSSYMENSHELAEQMQKQMRAMFGKDFSGKDDESSDSK